MIGARPLGATGVQVSPVGFGTVSLGVDYGIAAPGAFGRPADEQAVAALRHAAGRGITFYDTAPAYGEAERLVGAALGDDDALVVATKLTVPKGADGTLLRDAELERAVNESLARSQAALRRSTLDVVQIHNATVALLQDGDGGVLAFLEAARARGIVRLVGASVYSEEEALAAIHSRRIQVLQVAYNLLDQRMARRVFPEAQAAGVGVVVRSAFLKGALTDKAVYLPAALAALREAVDRARTALGVDWAALPQVALRFCLSHPAVSTVLVGARTTAELDTALDAAEQGPLAAAALEAARAVAVDDDALVNPSRWPVA
ncbi:MAG: oxidoreductase, aldo/keto reductase family [bacterium]|nr:oxidoreductase, aldo/keto reductase family [bacterium]